MNYPITTLLKRLQEVREEIARVRLLVTKTELRKLEGYERELLWAINHLSCTQKIVQPTETPEGYYALEVERRGGARYKHRR